MADNYDEAAVRQYLTAIKNPESLKDSQRLEELDKEIEKADDVLEEARLMAEQRRLANVQPSDYEQGFIKNAKAWADENEVPAETLKAMGVSNGILAKAGFEVTKSSPAKKATGKRVRRSDVEDSIRSFKEPFKLSEVAKDSDASMNTIRKVISEMVDSGQVKNLGDDPDHSGQGRPATLYQSNA